MRSVKVNGAAIRAEREARAMTLTDLATLTGAHIGHLSRIETGGREPGAKLFNAICAALGVDRVDLLAAEKGEAA